LFGADGVNELLQAYRLINPATAGRDLLGAITRYEEVWDGSGYAWETQSVYDLDLAKLSIALDGYFLTPVAGTAFGADDVATAKTSLDAAIDALIAGLSANPTAAVLFNFRRTTDTAAGADELIGFGQRLIASMSADTVLVETPEWVLRLHGFFDNPFTAASILADPDVEDWMWQYHAPVGSPEYDNASLELNGDALFMMLDTVIGLPEFPDATIYCQVDAECPDAAHGGQDYWECAGDESQGVCSHNRDITCASWSVCDALQNGSFCIFSTCAPREPRLFNYDLVDEAYDGEPPTFIDEALWDELSQGF
jgi:hypothetical protein